MDCLDSILSKTKKQKNKKQSKKEHFENKKVNKNKSESCIYNPRIRQINQVHSQVNNNKKNKTYNTLLCIYLYIAYRHT